MSAIDCYRHDVLGNFDRTAIYRLRQDVPATMEDDFNGKVGDILLGGGGGETPAMRISIPEAFIAYSDNGRWEHDFFEVTQTFWSDNNHAYYRIKRYKQLGYKPANHGLIEIWLTENILAFLVKNYPEQYAGMVENRFDFPIRYRGEKHFELPHPEQIEWANSSLRITPKSNINWV